MTAEYWLGYPLGAIALAGAICLPVQAEETNSSATNALDTVIIFGESYRSTGTKSELQPMQAPMSFERVEAEDLESRQVNSVNDALGYVSGVSSESRGGALTIFDQYTIRGFESYNNYYNGLPLYYNTNGNLAPQVDAYATDGIEILKGPASVLYGASSPGGMVNQTAKEPQFESSHEIQLTTGSNALMEAAVDSTGAVTDALDYRLVLLGRMRDGQQESTQEQRLVVAPSATWYPTDKTALNVNVYYQDDPKAIPSTPLPTQGTLNDASFDLSPASFVGDVNWGNVDKTVTMVGYKLNHDFSNNLTLLQNFRFTQGELYQKNSYHGGVSGTTLTRSFYYTDEELSAFSIDNQLALDMTFGPSDHNLLAGMEYTQAEVKFDYGDTLGAAANDLDLSDIDNHLIDPDSLDFTAYGYNKDIDESQLGFYFQDEIAIANTTFIAGARYDVFDSTTNQTYPGNPDKVVIDTDNLSFRFGAIHEFNNGISPYLSYSESFAPLSGDDHQGNPLDPETANQIEAGLKYSGIESMEITAAAYLITKQNATANRPGTGTVQTGEIQSTGIELAWYMKLLEQLSLSANLTLLDAEITENEGTNEGNTPQLVAEQTANIWANYQPMDALSIGGGIRYVGEKQLDNSNSDTVPSYTLVDASTEFLINEVYSLGLNVTNLLDEEYMTCSWGSNCWYGSPRNVELSFSARF